VANDWHQTLLQKLFSITQVDLLELCQYDEPYVPENGWYVLSS
jgi:hypothetical protein